MSETIKYTQAELRRVGHVCLSARLHHHPDDLLQLSDQYAITAEQAIKMGILATLLRIADDVSRLVGICNTVTMQEGCHVNQ